MVDGGAILVRENKENRIHADQGVPFWVDIHTCGFVI